MKTPNIVMVVIDAFRPKHMSLFGYQKETDSNLKKISKESIVFKKQFSVSNATAPALTSIFSGLYPSTHGVIHQFPYTKQEEFSKAEKISFWLPSYLKEKGYETIALDWIGFWFKKGFDYYKETEEKSDNLFPPTSQTIDLAIKKISSAKTPFFLFVHLWDTHFPFHNTPYTQQEQEQDMTKILSQIKDEKQKDYVKKRFEAIHLNSIKDIINKYDKTIKIIDTEIGRLYDYLKTNNLLENTIFIALGDHGDIINENKIYLSHCSLFDSAVQAPLIMHIPGIQGKEINGLVQNTDLVPTILELLGDDTIKLDGVSLMPLITEGKKVRDKVFLFDGLAEDVTAVRTENKKSIISKNNYCNLCKSTHHKEAEEYDLLNDPHEERNLLTDKSVDNNMAV